MNDALARVREIEGSGGPLSRIGEAVRLTIEAQGLPETEVAERTSRYEQALTELAEAAVERPAWSRIPGLQGNIYDLRGQTELAVQSYLQAINLGEQDPQLISRAILLLFNQGRFVEADGVVRKLQEQKTPFSSELTRVASEVSLRLENFDRARSLAQSSAERFGQGRRPPVAGRGLQHRRRYRRRRERIPDRHRARPRRAPAGWVSLVQMLAAPGRYRDSPSGHRGSSSGAAGGGRGRRHRTVLSSDQGLPASRAKLPSGVAEVSKESVTDPAGCRVLRHNGQVFAGRTPAVAARGRTSGSRAGHQRG